MRRAAAVSADLCDVGDTFVGAIYAAITLSSSLALGTFAEFRGALRKFCLAIGRPRFRPSFRRTE